jgi:hypothetical protein
MKFFDMMDCAILWGILSTSLAPPPTYYVAGLGGFVIGLLFYSSDKKY